MKVSFKEEDFKKVKTFNDKVTEVVLTGFVINEYPVYHFDSIQKYMQDNPYVKADYTFWDMKIVAKGKAMLSDGDSFNAVVGERLAEARAKINIYKFMCAFIRILMKEYTKILYGTYEGTGNCHTVVRPDFKEDFRMNILSTRYSYLKRKHILKSLLISHESNSESNINY